MTAPDTIARALYSVREFCERNSISRTTLWRLIKAGVLRKVKAGRKVLVTAESERAWHLTHDLPMVRCGTDGTNVKHGETPRVEKVRYNGHK